MKLLPVFLSFSIILTISSCSSKIEKFEKDLETCISKTDSVQYLLKNTLNDKDFMDEILQSEVIWNQLKLKYEYSNDTLSAEQMKVLDNFNVAFHNAKNLRQERLKCLVASSEQRLRLQQLKNDIELGNGKRSEYCANVQHEKEELTIIRNHAMDIHRRFEELKSSKAQFENTFSRYSLN